MALKDQSGNEAVRSRGHDLVPTSPPLFFRHANLRVSQEVSNIACPSVSARDVDRRSCPLDRTAS